MQIRDHMVADVTEGLQLRFLFDGAHLEQKHDLVDSRLDESSDVPDAILNRAVVSRQ